LEKANINFGLDYRKSERSCFHPTGPQYLLGPGAKFLLNPLSGTPESGGVMGALPPALSKRGNGAMGAEQGPAQAIPAPYARSIFSAPS